jgi:hypothetical protein
MSNDPGRHEQARRDVLEPVDQQRRAGRPILDEPAGRRNGVDRHQGQKMNDASHVGAAALAGGMATSSHAQPKTFTALAITRAIVETATTLCTSIIAFAERVKGIVSVGENAITFVRLHTSSRRTRVASRDLRVPVATSGRRENQDAGAGATGERPSAIELPIQEARQKALWLRPSRPLTESGNPTPQPTRCCLARSHRSVPS